MLKFWHQPIEQDNHYLPPLVVDSKTVLFWETCRRKIYFYLDESAFLADSRGFMQGLEAESFLIEVLCGLHSPVVGETEILGQFRQLVSQNADHAWVQKFQPRIQTWISLIKEIREKYLCKFGSQSYGGYLRRLFYNHSEVQIVGAGSLVEDMLPWLKAKNVQVYARNPEKSQVQVMQHLPQYDQAKGSLSIHKLEASLPTAEALVIAAPLSHEQVKELVEKSQGLRKFVVDLRRDSKLFNDRDPKVENWVTLEDVMEFFSQQKDLLSSRQQQAQAAVNQWRLAQMDKVTLRPFGWEDLCG